MQFFPLFAATSPSDPPHSNDRSMFYYYFIVAVTALVLLLVMLNMFAAGCCTCRNLVHGIEICLRSVGFLSNTPKDNGISLLIPSSKYKKEKGAMDDDDNECSVCLMAFKNGEEVRKMPKCGHLFHAPCIDMWLYSHSNCPMCRADVFPEPTGTRDGASRVISV